MMLQWRHSRQPHQSNPLEQVSLYSHAPTGRHPRTEDVVLAATLLVVERSIVPSLMVGINVDSLGVMEAVA